MVYGAPLLCLLLIGLAVFMLRDPDDKHAAPLPVLQVFCVELLRPQIEEIAEAFQRRSGVQVDVDYGTHDFLIRQMARPRKCAVFLSDTPGHIEKLSEKGLVSELPPVTLNNSVTAVVLAGSDPAGPAPQFVRFLEGPAALRILSTLKN